MSQKGIIIRKLTALVLIVAIVLVAGFVACEPLKNIAGAFDKVLQDAPTAENTLTSLPEINKAIEEAMSRGETELTFNAADVGETELQRINDNLSTFWGQPVRYSINSEIENVEDVIEGRTVDVKNITNSFQLSNNYYVYDYIKNGTPIPEDRPNAKKIADALPGIAAEVFTDPSATDYEKTLAAHDWLVANIEYDSTMRSNSDNNGAYGAIALKQTMCQGYAEALELLLKCYTDIEIVQIVGEALNADNDNTALSETDEASEDSATGEDVGTGAAAEDGETGAEPIVPENGDGDTVPTPAENETEWGGHAWNMVRLDGSWYHIDPTFDDPRGNPAGQVSHFYFGQTDEVMSANHRWSDGYFPAANTESFLYFRQSGLLAGDWEGFESVVTGILSETPVASFEAAVVGATVDEENIQFIYQVRDDLEMIRWSEQVWQDIHVQSIELYYS